MCAARLATLQSARTSTAKRMRQMAHPANGAAAELFDVARRTVQRARVVLDSGSAKLIRDCRPWDTNAARQSAALSPEKRKRPPPSRWPKSLSAFRGIEAWPQWAALPLPRHALPRHSTRVDARLRWPLARRCSGPAWGARRWSGRWGLTGERSTAGSTQARSLHTAALMTSADSTLCFTRL